MFERQRQDAELRRLQRVKRTERAPMGELGQEVVGFFKGAVQKRQTKMVKIADVWGKLVPALLAEHCALESFHRGTLTVIVDSSSHLYDLKQLLLAGLEKQILLACGGAGVKKVAVKLGRWYEEADGEKKVRFQ